MGKDLTEVVRNRAVGMVEGGSSISEVARTMNVHRATVWRWMKAFKAGKSLGVAKGRGRKSSLTRAAKIVISKSLTKKGYSTRKLATKLTKHGHPTSKSAVHRHLRENLGVKPYRPRFQPKLTEEQKKKRVAFCKMVKEWTPEDWKKVIFSDESPFELFHPVNRKNDVIWAHSSDSVIPSATVKFPAKVMVWGAISSQALSKLHVIPQKQSVNTEYYIDEILKKTLMEALLRTGETGGLLERQLCHDMSEAIFQHDGAPCHFAKKTTKWIDSNLNFCWGKGVWPPNSPDLSPIENV